MIKFLRALKEKTDWRTLLLHSSWSLTLTSGVSYFFGLIRDRIFVQTFGLSRTLDIYNASFVLPDLLLSLFIGTALSAAFVPIFTRQYDKEKQLGFAYSNQIMTMGVTLIAVLGIICAIFLPTIAPHLVPGFKGDDLTMYIQITRIMLLSPIIFAVSNTYGEILISIREFFWWGLSPALYNIGIILGAIYLYPKFGILGMIFGTLFGGLLHLSIRFIPIWKQRSNFKTRPDFRLTPEVKETIKLMLPKMLQYGMWSFMLMNFTSITSALPEGSVAAYNYAYNFMSLPVSLLGIAIAMAVYPTLSHDASKGNYTKFKADFKRERLRSIFYTTLAAIGLALIAKPMITLLLGGGKFGPSGVQLLANVLTVYCIAIPLESLMHMYHRAYYSLLNSLIPSMMHSFTILLIILMAHFFSKTIGVYAIPVSFSLGMILHITVLAAVFPILMRKRVAELIDK